MSLKLYILMTVCLTAIIVHKSNGEDAATAAPPEGADKQVTTAHPATDAGNATNGATTPPATTAGSPAVHHLTTQFGILTLGTLALSALVN